MNPALRVLKNSTALSASVLLERGVSFILPWYVARVQGKEPWGYYSTALTFVTIASTFAYWGLDQLLPREIARDRKRAGAFLANAALIGGLVSLVTVVIMVAVVSLLDYPVQVRNLIFMGLLLTLVPLTETVLCEATINGLEKMEWIVAVHLPLTVLRVAASIYLLSRGFDLGVLFAILAVYYLLAWSTYLVLFRRLVPTFGWEFDRTLAKTLAIQAVPFVLVIFVGQTFRQIDRVFLSKLWDTDAVGVYATGAMLVQLMYLIAPAIMTALFPSLSRLYVASQQRFSEIVSQLFKLFFAGIFPVALAIIAFARPVILLLFGQEYNDSVIVLQILALGIVPSFVARLLYRTILASNNEHLAVRVAFVSSAVNISLNVILIPRYGVLGASVVAVCTELVGLAQNLFYVSRRIIPFDFRRSLLWPTLCAVVSLLFCVSVMRWNSPAAWFTASSVFLAALFFSRTITWDELRALSSVRTRS